MPKLTALDSERNILISSVGIKEAAALIGCSKSTVQRWKEKGAINGKYLFVPDNQLNHYLSMPAEVYGHIFYASKKVILCDEQGTPVHRFTTVAECAQFLNTAVGVVTFRILSGAKINKWTPMFCDASPSIKRIEKQCKYKKHDTDTFVPYQTVKKKILITPCPYRDWDNGNRPLVGSANCAACTSFRGKDRENQNVRCAIKKNRDKEIWKKNRS